MKSLINPSILLLIFIFCSSAYARQPSFFDKLSFKIGSGECMEAEVMARKDLTPPLLYTALGIINIDCKKDKREAIKFFNMAASLQETLAITKLTSLGEPLPIANNKASNQIIIQNFPLPPPMPPTTISTPQPTIILQPQINIERQSNPNACIQDGGGIFCPNYRR